MTLAHLFLCGRSHVLGETAGRAPTGNTTAGAPVRLARFAEASGVASRGVGWRAPGSLSCPGAGWQGLRDKELPPGPQGRVQAPAGAPAGLMGRGCFLLLLR